MDLEHLSTVLSTENKTINLRLRASLFKVKGLIKSILPLNDGFNTETPVWRESRLKLTLKSIYCKQNTEVT